MELFLQQKQLNGSAAEIEIFTLPKEYRPSKPVRSLCQGTGKNSWLLSVDTDGQVIFSRYGTNDFASASTTVWLVLQINYFVD